MKQQCRQRTITSITEILEAMQVSMEYSREAGFTGSKPHLVQLITEEACTNAWEYQAAAGRFGFEIQWYLDDMSLEITVFQQEGCFALPRVGAPPKDPGDGGFFLFKALRMRFAV
ncbi:ATP-binding protein [Paenibacillus hexagrammi]|uniref:ATP-binding protein n=1 Tax=Paenibacillus hexagrammi TaxID=2908839 RepID=A0ABY3SIA5_9BACL|nr:ATP-binding protein [Paenibacillus sp. YPD9-1]UJF32881.1 ATP-binding protein [Paenibacillus sp. YPD9-1]